MAVIQRVGKVYIKADGKALDSLPGAKLSMGGVERNTVKGNNAILGYSEVPTESAVECKVALGKGQKLEDFRKISAATLTFECDTGQTYVVAKAWLATPPTLADTNGEVDLKFNGPPAEEVS